MQRTPRAGTSPPVLDRRAASRGCLPIPTPPVPVPPRTHAQPQRQTNDNCPLRHRPTSPYIGCMRHSCARYRSFPRRLGSFSLWEKAEDEGSDGRQWNEMEQNGTELKGSSLLATRDEANQGRLAHRVRVSGVPNEATVAPFSASLLGVNEANQGQMGPGINPPRRSREDGNLASLCGRPCVDVGAVREPPEVTPPPTYPQTNDNCPLHHAPAGCYIVHIRRSPRRRSDPFSLEGRRRG